MTKNTDPCSEGAVSKELAIEVEACKQIINGNMG